MSIYSVETINRQRLIEDKLDFAFVCGVWFLTFNIWTCIGAVLNIIGNWCCIPIIFKNPIKSDFSIKKIYCFKSVSCLFELKLKLSICYTKTGFKWIIKDYWYKNYKFLVRFFCWGGCEHWAIQLIYNVQCRKA